MCPLSLDPGTWADWFLVLVGGIGGVVAYQTLNTLKEQTKQAAEDAVLLNRAYLTVDFFMPKVEFEGYVISGVHEPPCRVSVKFRVYNPSRTAARIETIEWQSRQQTGAVTVGRMLTPGEAHWFEIPQLDSTVGAVRRLQGTVTYRDIFRKIRHRSFARIIICDAEKPTTEDAEGIGLNDELEWNQD
jgi:hypothetical protein